MPGLLNPAQRPGLLGGGYNPIRQIAAGGSPGQPSSMMQMGGGMGDPNQYGSDAWALQGGGPGALFWRELVRGMMGKNGEMNYNVFDRSKQNKFFSPEVLSYINPDSQKGRGGR